MEQSNLLELAKQGEPTAIAALMNAVLKPKGITAHASFEGDILCIALESPKPLNQETLLTFIRKGLLELGNDSIQTVRAQGKKTGEKEFSWRQEFLVYPVPTVVAEPEIPPVQPETADEIVTEIAPEATTIPEDSSSLAESPIAEVSSDSEHAISTDVETAEGIVESSAIATEPSAGVAVQTLPDTEEPSALEGASEEEVDLEDEAAIEEDDSLEPQSLRAWLKLYWKAYSLPVLLVVVGGFFAGGTMAFWKTSQAQNQVTNEEIFQPPEQTLTRKQVEAEKYLKAMNKAQEEFYQKNKRFAKSLEELERSANLIAQSYSYAYRLRITESEKSPQSQRSLITASPRETGLQSYVGAVFVMPTGTSSIICQTPKPSMEAPAAPQMVKKKLACAPRSLKVQ